MSLLDNISALVNQVGVDVGNLKGTFGNINELSTTEKTNLVIALAEVQEGIEAARALLPQIDDAVESTQTLFSSIKVTNLLETLKNEIIAGADSDHDSLAELVAILQDDDVRLTALLTAANGAVSFDTPQTLSDSQVAQAWENIDIGDSAFDLGEEYESYVGSNSVAEPGVFARGIFV